MILLIDSMVYSPVQKRYLWRFSNKTIDSRDVAFILDITRLHPRENTWKYSLQQILLIERMKSIANPIPVIIGDSYGMIAHEVKRLIGQKAGHFIPSSNIKSCAFVLNEIIEQPSTLSYLIWMNAINISIAEVVEKVRFLDNNCSEEVILDEILSMRSIGILRIKPGDSNEC